MNAVSRSWPYGTRKSVQVLDVYRSRGCQVLACHEEETAEAFVLVMAREVERIEPGELGLITFCRGGPTGGYWDYRKGVGP